MLVGITITVLVLGIISTISILIFMLVFLLPYEKVDMGSQTFSFMTFFACAVHTKQMYNISMIEPCEWVSTCTQHIFTQ